MLRTIAVRLITEANADMAGVENVIRRLRWWYSVYPDWTPPSLLDLNRAYVGA
jgi:hypothetical protein